MPLSDTAIRKLKPADKNYKKSDEKGLYLQVTPKGQKYWRFKYRFRGKEKLLALGVYPDVSLKLARERRDKARQQVADDIDPAKAKQAIRTASIERQANSFEVVAREWFLSRESTWGSETAKRILRGLEKDIFPWMGQNPISELTPPDVLSVIRRIESRGTLETAHRMLGKCGEIFRYAVATGRAERDPAADLKGALPPTEVKHFPAITDPVRVGELLRVLDGYSGTMTVKAALKLAPLVFLRPGDLRNSLWEDVDFERSEWHVLTGKTKTELIIPLARQAVDILKELKPITGRSKYIFPNGRSVHRPMSDNAVLGALRRLDIPKDEMTGHGFRAMARTLMDEELEIRTDFIEHQLAHSVRDPNGRAYNRTSYRAQRHEMMQKWADYLDELKRTV